MSEKLHLTLGCGDYESIRALKDGTVKADGIELTVLTDMDSETRHWRMLRNREFDVAEVSLSSYLMATDRGHPFTAIPVFLHRRFRHGFVFTNAEAGIREPKDLIGKRVGAKTFQATAILWLRGILEHEYGVPQNKVQWVTELDEDVEFTPPPGLSIERAPHGQRVEDMVATGEVAAVLHPDLIDPFMAGDPRVGRLFPNYREVEIDYFKRTGIFPIMHVTALKAELVEKHPWVVFNLMKAFEAAKRAAYERMKNPRIVPLAWYRSYQEMEREILGDDPWAYGLGEANRKNLETAIGYSHDSGLIGRRLAVEELFTDLSPGRGRGQRKRI
jgi:4,5-dihydroxyphthalate decarboxylase